MLTFRLAVVHSLPSAMRLEEAIVPDRFWSFAERCVEPAPPTNPNAILSAIAATRIRIGVRLTSPPQCSPAAPHGALGSKHPVEPTDDGHEKAKDEQEHPQAIGPAIFGKKLKPGKRLSIGHGALRDGARADRRRQ